MTGRVLLSLYPSEHSLSTSHGYYGGLGYIAGEAPDGLLTVGGAPASRRIDVFSRNNGLIIKTVWSNADGTYVILGLNPDLEFDLIGRDYARVYGDFIRYAVKPKPY